MLLCLGDMRGAEGGVREFDRGAVEDIGRRELFFCLIGKPARAEKFARGSRSKPRGEIGIRAKGVGENLLVTRLKT